MCIRDRYASLQAACEAAVAAEIANGAMYDRLLNATQRPDTVSYTHLRAHETVLDLVCRLLLEKKNKHLITC